VVPKPGFQYVAVKVVSAKDLLGLRSGFAHSYVRVSWESGAMVQTTKMVHRSRDPEYNDTLYFPVRLACVDREAIEAKGLVHFEVWHEKTPGVQAARIKIGECDLGAALTLLVLGPLS
jgi:hypothetical protein